jgi:hypothetical protein
MEIKITRSAAACCVSGRDFMHDEEYVSVLRVREGEFHREDYAKEHWEERFREGAYSVWTPKYYDPKVAEAEPAETFSPLRQLFYEAQAGAERVEQAKAFLAAQLLRRQKVFRLVKESDETETEVRISLYSDRLGNRLIEVRDPSFTYPELEAGRQLLLARLRELEQPAPPAAADTAPGDTAADEMADAPAGDAPEAPAQEAPDHTPEEVSTHA